ncbi:exodeoxyribonuclease VII small subunit [Parapedobacter sp. ISTM3]|uniref:Exodeoxyribonuclease VII small subunit n=1 Tax=Parapedobacter luteus TaxID=623280 RepID=A0A1T5D2U7_9SPHI|nr:MULTISPECIES: exodeoxyribonuclease VII small subunit [Parapedobacter]MBK1440511.1 exodeoxyribonuclease VII small subunit [Parapedobacter sp. ISTM3]SKB66032.1 Exodeoxyribonuclease VII small subunit [Parapedobacter luteus]
MSNEKYTYTDAFNELQTIVAEIERGEITIDELSEKVKRATLLISVCKAKLTATEEEVNTILASLATDVDSSPPTEEE